MAWYEIWSTESNNLLAEADTEEEALEIVREFLDVDPSYETTLSLAFVEDPLSGHNVAHGQALADLARRTTPSRSLP